MRVYCSADWRAHRTEEHPSLDAVHRSGVLTSLADALVASGHEVHRWWDGDHGDYDVRSRARYCVTADVVVVWVPAAHDAKVELGLALAASRPVVIWGDDADSDDTGDWYGLPEVKARVSSGLTEVVDAVCALEPRPPPRCGRLVEGEPCRIHADHGGPCHSATTPVPVGVRVAELHSRFIVGECRCGQAIRTDDPEAVKLIQTRVDLDSRCPACGLAIKLQRVFQIAGPGPLPRIPANIQRN